MLTVTQSKNSWVNFAREHVQLGEIDTPYVLMDRAVGTHGKDWVERFALYYFMFYDLEGAAKAAYAPNFWRYVEDVYPTAKRGGARRHFRGDKGIQALLALQRFGSPNQVWYSMYKPNYSSLVENITRKFQGCQIGPYFAWKAMDIFDRCLGMPVNLSLSETLAFLPDVPRKGAKVMWPDDTLEVSLNRIGAAIGDIPAPGNDYRKCGYPEVETILCAMYGVQKGTYHVGDDIQSRHTQLRDHPDLVRLLPPIQDWSQYAAHPLVA